MAENENVETNTGGENLDGGDSTNNGAAKEKVEFSSEQQAKVQAIVDDATRRAYQKANDESKTHMEKVGSQIQALEDELDAQKKKATKNPDGVDESKKVIDQLNKDKADLEDKMHADSESYKNERKTTSLYAAIGKQDVQDIESIVTLLRNNIDIDEEGKLIVKGDGGPRLNKHGDPIKIDEYVEEWLHERPHFLKGSNGGAGSNGSMGGSGKVKQDLSNPEVWRNMSPDTRDKLLKEGVTITNPNGTKYHFGSQSNPFTEARKRKFKE